MPKGNKGKAARPTPSRADREIVLHPQFWDHLRHWAAMDKKMENRLMNLVEEIIRDPFGGTSKPEPLKHQFRGCWARRLNDEHRVIYRVEGTAVHFLSAREHYPKHH